jgi:HAD superfamily hydrolase (TIGR01509 family)
MATTAPIQVLFFDVGNTLLFPSRERMLRVLHERNIFPPEDLLREIERKTKLEFDSLQESNAAIDHGFWHIFYSHLLDELGVPNEDDCKSLVACTRISGNWRDVRAGTRDVLKRLAGSYRLGVISNADGKIADALASAGIADCFESITDSGIVGTEKPHPVIFAAAVNSLGVKPESSLYIGDVYSVDYVGATTFGMRAVLFDVSGAYRDNTLPRVESLEQLELYLQRT